MSDIEKRKKELTDLEERPNEYAREIQEGKRNLQTAEQNAASREDVDRVDYLFDQVNQNRRVVVETPVIQIAPSQKEFGLPVALCCVAAVSSVVTLILVSVICIGLALM